MMRKGIAVLAALTVLSVAGSAWALGLGIGYKIPTGDFGDLYEGGFGANFSYMFPLAPTVTGWGDVGYTRFMTKSSLDELDPLALGDLDVWGFNAGAKAGLGTFYVGGEIGYYTEIYDGDFGLTPLIGIGFSKLDFSARYKLTGDANWFDIRASLSF